MAEMLTLTFLLYKIYILCFCFPFFFFFYLKLTLYYCEVLLISVKPIVNNKDIDEYSLLLVVQLLLIALAILDEYLRLKLVLY